MIEIRPRSTRGRTQLDWLDSFHTFSFGSYYDPANLSFSALRVLNEDRVAVGSGFPMHPHREMEILTYVISGALEHKDSTGATGVIRPGEIQRMTAGIGIQHSEWNHSTTEPVHFLQIWILPERAGLAPEYEHRSFSAGGRPEGFVRLASRNGGGTSVKIHQDMYLYGLFLPTGEKSSYEMRPRRAVWVQAVRGVLIVNGKRLAAGDGAGIKKESKLEFAAEEDAEALVFDLYE